MYIDEKYWAHSVKAMDNKHPVLMNVHGLHWCSPSLVNWSLTAVKRDGSLSSKEVFDITSKYASHLIDHEVKIVNDQLVYLIKNNLISGITELDDGFFVFANIDGESWSMHVVIECLMEHEENWEKLAAVKCNELTISAF
ncbi:hypothetical protein FOPPYZMZ_CDS0112 [Pseudomonas phage 9Ps-7B]|uniref:PHIKZ264 n=2 Tax=root TaxID=1 RepID=Q8SCP8_BPDPK|nr:PHIKZ264 [Pseudomonas phage phiKZ]MCT4994496.1 hypothetical protein [Pseudomonas aeruginosa]QGK89944.1 hypothetical protein [Pseudomonas phage vB_PA32_GUMS]USL86535.1 hypothetical protein CDGHABPJ_00071 [Pseudomonas phage OMKO1]UXD83732.1 hypothetical protein NP274_00332 [Pseudomonas phage Koomba boorn-mokiny kep-wari Wadjak 2]WNV47982.1 hypothetical protein [Pseudomonas phage fMGyn-Pae01]WPJ69436.1 hypothetical protein PAZH1_313 [Pseudomonas phage PA_ZH1]WRQ05547.1 hypothetical protein I